MKTVFVSISRWATYASGLFLVAMMMITVADVVLRAIFNLPITGTYDLVQLFLVGTVFLSIPDVFLRDRNIVIDFVDHVFGQRAIGFLKLIANVFAVVFLVLLLWRMVPPARDALNFHETSPDLSIPMWVHWVLMLIGIGLTLPAAVLMLIQSALNISHPEASPQQQADR
jgi:TRAP-type C4-dicarboxylate transport system permease small subunit